ncbi:MAG: hypothetical protein Q9164_007476 [Protoblastenia rupestris]
MLKPFIDIGIDVNGRDIWPKHNLLGHAAAAGNMDVVYMLLDAGTNGALALYHFLRHSKALDVERFELLLVLLVESARPTTFGYDWHDGLLSIILSSRALSLHPEAPNVLLSRRVYSSKLLGAGVAKCDYDYSYMYQAISEGHPYIVELLLQHGAHADAQIGHLFDYQEPNAFEKEPCKCLGYPQCSMCMSRSYLLQSYTWLTLSVMSGAADCADVLIQYGTDVTALDGAGRSAIHIARSNVVAPHPRFSGDCLIERSVCAEEDAETLAVVEKAYNLILQGTEKIEDCVKPSRECECQPPMKQYRVVTALRKSFEKVFGFFLTPSQIERLMAPFRNLTYSIKKVWKLPFHEALLMRFFYALSYILIIAVEVLAFAKGNRRVPTPSRSLVIAAALLLVAIIWGPSQLGLS